MQSFARILRVNNNPGVNANFTTLQAAHDSARARDTLYVEGSPTSYGFLDCNKTLIIFGPGYYLSENPNLQALQQSAKVNAVNFYTGSAGSVIMGMDFTSQVIVDDDSITIKRNKFIQPYFAYPFYPEYTINTVIVNYRSILGNSQPVKNIIISQNYGLILRVPYASSKILITNNYFTYGGSPNININDRCLNVSSDAEVVVKNNIFRSGTIAINAETLFMNNIVYDNLFIGDDSLVTNNIWKGNQVPATHGNKTEVDMDNVFEGYGTGNYTDAQWKLKLNSPARGAGFGSTAQNPIDAGIFSGEAPYIISGMPPIPSIYSFETTPVGSNTIPLTITLKVKSGG